MDVKGYAQPQFYRDLVKRAVRTILYCQHNGFKKAEFILTTIFEEPETINSARVEVAKFLNRFYPGWTVDKFSCRWGVFYTKNKF